MAPLLIIITGCPGSGKSTLAALVCRRFPQVALLSYDAVKEAFFDRYGFGDEAEKKRVNATSLQAFYQQLDELMQQGRSILIEYPFCQTHRSDLQHLIDKHAYQAFTILLEGDPWVLYQRSLLRDQRLDRHPGHLHSTYYRGQKAPPPPLDRRPDFDAFLQLCKTKDYDIQLGSTLRVNVTLPSQDAELPVLAALEPMLATDCKRAPLD